MGGGLVQDHDRRVFQEGAGDRDALGLTAGYGQASGTHTGVEAAGQRLKEFAEVGGSQGLDQLVVRGSGRGQEQVVAQRAGEQVRGLLDDRALGSYPRQGRGSQVDAVEAHAAARGAQEALQQRRDRRLSGTRGTRERDVLALGDGQVYALQDRGVRGVGEGHVRQGDLAGGGRERGYLHSLLVGDGRSLRNEFLDFLVGRDAAHADVEELADAVQRVEHDRGEEHEGDALADTDRALPVADEGEGDRAGDHAEGEDGVDDEEDQLVTGQVAHDLRADFFGSLGQALTHVLAGVHEGQVAQALDGVEFLGGELAGGVPVARGHRLESLAEAHDADRDQRDRDREESARGRVDRQGDDDDDEDRGRQRRNHGGQENALVGCHALDAVCRGVDDAARALVGALRGPQGEDLSDHRMAQRGLHLVDLGGSQGADRPREHAGSQGPQHADPPRRPGVVSRNIIDAPADRQVGGGQAEGRCPRADDHDRAFHRSPIDMTHTSTQPRIALVRF